MVVTCPAEAEGESIDVEVLVDALAVHILVDGLQVSRFRGGGGDFNLTLKKKYMEINIINHNDSGKVSMYLYYIILAPANPFLNLMFVYFHPSMQVLKQYNVSAKISPTNYTTGHRGVHVTALHPRSASLTLSAYFRTWQPRASKGLVDTLASLQPDTLLILAAPVS